MDASSNALARSRLLAAMLLGALVWAGGCEQEPARVCERLGALCDEQNRVHRFDAPLWASASADLDGDGKDDLVTALPDLGLAIAWSGDGVRDYRMYPGGTQDVGLADLDGDGDMDVLLLADGALRVLENTGGRALGETQVLAVEGRPESLWVGALDEDGWPDVVVATSVRGGLTLFKGRGLEGRERVELGEDLSAVEVADLEGDGALEIVATDFSAGALVVVPAKGAGEATPVRSACGPAPEFLQLVDFDGDGRVEAWTHGRGAAEVWLHAGLGAGAFGPPQGLDVLQAPSPGFAVHRDARGVNWVLAGADGRLVASELDASGAVVRRVMNGAYSEVQGVALDGGMALGRGARHFVRYDLQLTRMFTEVWNGGPRDINTINPVVLGDFTQDGILDVAVEPKNGVLAIYVGQLDGQWVEHTRLDISKYTLRMAAGDVTGDGLLDLVIAESGDPFAVTIAVGQGDGSFVLGPTVPTRVFAWSLLTFDPSGTGATAVALAHDSKEPGVDVLTFDVMGGLVGEVTLFPDAYASYLAAADLDGDGREELVALVREESEYALVRASPTGDGWGPPQSRPLSDVMAMAGIDYPRSEWGVGLGHVDQNDEIDAVLLMEGALVRLHDFAADAPPAAQIDEVPQGRGAHHVAIAHVDDDGSPDVVFGSPAGMFMALGAADGSLQVQPPFDEFVWSASLVVDPVTQRPTAAYSSGRGISVLAPAIAPRLVRVDSFGASVAAAILATGDVDGDGRTDVVVSEVPSDYDGGFSVHWGSDEGLGRRATGADATGGTGPLCVAPLDSRPGDEIVAAGLGGVMIYAFADGSLTRLGTASTGDDGITKAAPLARAKGPGDIVTLHRLYDSTVRLIALGRPERDDFKKWEEPVVLWQGPEGKTPPDLAIADFDGDSFDDVALFPGEGQPVQIVWGDAGRAGPVTTLAVDPTRPRTLTAGDLDGDGRPELLVGMEWETMQIGFDGRTPRDPGRVGRGCQQQRFFLADLEGDGLLDVLCEEWWNLRVELRAPGRPDQSVWFGYDDDYAFGVWTSTHAAELDGDGILDLVAIREGAVIMRLSGEDAR